MRFRCAAPAEITRIADFYQQVIRSTPGMQEHARWIYGQHPTDAMLQGYLDRHELYVLEEADAIAAAMAVTMAQGKDYHSIPWALSLPDDAVAVIHILCVSPDFQRQGLGQRMISECFRMAGQSGKASVRLDALASNLPARRMYEAAGFQLRGIQRQYAPNTGWTDFLFYEKQLD